MNLDSNKEYSVNWKNHMSHVRKAFDHLLTSNELTDVTLCCEGKKIGAHKMLLSACSGYFRDTFKELPCQHPVIILYGVEYTVLSDILRFIYNGEVSVDTSKLDSFLKVAQILQISGLTDDPKVVNASSDSNLERVRTEENCISQTNDSASLSTEDVKRGIKRTRIQEGETSKEKVQRQESDSLFVADVKCEPSELVDFEDPVEDPLQADQPQEQKNYFDNGITHMVTEEDIKIEENRSFEKFAEKCQPTEKIIPFNTRKSRNCIWSAFKNFCKSKRYVINESTTVQDVSDILADWGFNMKKHDGTDYKEGVVKTIWNTTAKMLQELFSDKYNITFDPFRDTEFKKARDLRDIKRKQLKSCPEKRKVSRLSLSESERLQIYSIWDENTPSGLQKKFYHVAAFQLKWRSVEASKCLIQYFRQEFDLSGNFTGRIEYNPYFNQSIENLTYESKWLVANNQNPDICPVRLLLKMFDKRAMAGNIKTNRLFLASNPNWNESDKNPWYKDCPVGRNQMGTWSKEGAQRIGIDAHVFRLHGGLNLAATSKIN